MGATLTDSFGRRIEYLRLSVTDKCNLRCFYCLPRHARGFARRHDWLSFDEIERVIAAFGQLGVHRVRITGGEPLLRNNLPALARRLRGTAGIEEISISTNAILLTRSAVALRRAGVKRINVSLDTLRPERFESISSGGKLADVLTGLAAARDAGFRPIKINMLALRGVNDDEFEDMVEFCRACGFTLRFIETMPVGDAGREASRHYLDLQTVHKRLAKKYELIPTLVPGGGPARYFRVNGSSLSIGFITPISRHFCASCNRVRLAVDGTLYLCLGQEHKFELRPLLRAGISDAELRTALVKAIRCKPERHEFGQKPHHVIRFMSATGG
jgi:cyclic pyranopterin phosphate synthase